MQQLTLSLTPRKRRKPSQLDLVEEIMRDGEAHTLPEIESKLRERGRWAQGTSLSARMRELPKKRGLFYRKFKKGDNDLVWYQRIPEITR